MAGIYTVRLRWSLMEVTKLRPEKREGIVFACLVVAFAAVASAAERAVYLESPLPRVFLSNSRLTLKGRAASGIASVTIAAHAKDNPRTLLRRAVRVGDNGAFSFTIHRNELAPARRNVIIASVSLPRADGDVALSHSVEVFVFPELSGRKLPRATVENGRLMREGRPFGFVGTNYTGFQLGLSNRSNYEAIVRAIDTMADWGVAVVRVPLNFGLIQVAEGVFPDNPKWVGIYQRHRLDPEFMNQLDYFVAYAGQRGIYTVIDWHGFPINPFRYFLGGKTRNQELGKPGGAIAWLARDPTKKEKFRLDNPKHMRALVTTHAWMARHFKGNPNILGFEVPHNEPHDAFSSVQANLARVTAACAEAVKREDQTRLTFFMTSNYGHNNSTWISTWMLPAGVDGAAPHFYMANGPVPLRPEAKTMKQPWLCRDVRATFSYSLPAVVLPLSAVGYPIYNGEGGEHGAASLLPDIDPPAAWEAMLECSLVQYYAAGLTGFLNWTLWGNRRHFPAGIYRRQLRRFAPVYAAGPVDWSEAELAFVQNPGAEAIANGHNFSCVPFARLMLNLHLGPVHYLTDDQLLFTGIAERDAGLEQADSPSARVMRYKAFLIDRRNLDARVERILAKLKAPTLWVDNASKLTTDELAAFLEKAGVAVDRRTPPEIQIVCGPRHLVLYRREGEGQEPVRVFPLIAPRGRVRLVDETGGVAFEGTAEELTANGFTIALKRWRSRIYRIEALHGDAR